MYTPLCVNFEHDFVSHPILTVVLKHIYAYCYYLNIKVCACEAHRFEHAMDKGTAQGAA